MTTSQPTGVFAASLTPMTPDLGIDIPHAVAHNKWLLANGCDGVAPPGHNRRGQLARL